MGDTTHDELRLAVERLYEDERLRADLTDDEAKVLLEWGRGQLDEAARRVRKERREADFHEIANRLHEVIRQISRLASQNSLLSDSEFEDSLRHLDYRTGPEQALSRAALRVLDERGALDSLVLVRQLVEVAEDSSTEGNSAPA